MRKRLRGSGFSRSAIESWYGSALSPRPAGLISRPRALRSSVCTPARSTPRWPRDIPLEKVSPSSVAARILDAVEQGRLEMYPDPMAVEVGRQYESNPLALERQVSGRSAAA